MSYLPGMALKTLVKIARLVKILIILGERLLISNLPDKALRPLVDIARLVKQFNMSSQS